MSTADVLQPIAAPLRTNAYVGMGSYPNAAPLPYNTPMLYSSNVNIQPIDVATVNPLKPVAVTTPVIVERPVVNEISVPQTTENQVRVDQESKWTWFGWMLLWFIAFLLLFWLLEYSLKPSWVLDENGEADTARILLTSFIFAALLILLIYAAKLFMRAYGW